MPDTLALLTVKQVAERLQLSDDAITGLIARKAIRAIDVSTPGSRKPRWRIKPEALDDFLATRTNTPTPAKSPRRQRSSESVIEFFK
jgi:excisionase family DNA binding protein